MTNFNALMMHQEDDGNISNKIEELNIDDLPEGDVLVRINHSSLNYKDGMIIDGNKGRLVRKFPHIPGIDFAGHVESSSDPRYTSGDRVILTGWRVGEVHWGGYSQYARVSGDWLVPCPETLTNAQAMGIGTAGLTAMLSILKLQSHGIDPSHGPVLVTGAAGGVGSISVAILAQLGYEVSASTGRRALDDYLKDLGASNIIDRNDLAEPVKAPLESEQWIGAIDSVGDSTLSRLLGQMKYQGIVAACGLAGGAQLNATVLPFLLRGVTLTGIDSVMCPRELRIQAWTLLGDLLLKNKLDATIQHCKLQDIVIYAKDILKGKIRGRMVVDI